MSMAADDAALLAAGSTIVRRDAQGGKIWTATPNRVINDSGSELMIACWPGVEMLAPTTWIEWLQSGDDRARQQSISNLATGHWDLGRWTWRDTSLLSWFGTGIYFSVHRFLPAGKLACDWYVNFERPRRRTGSASTPATCSSTSWFNQTCPVMPGRTRANTHRPGGAPIRTGRRLCSLLTR